MGKSDPVSIRLKQIELDEIDAYYRDMEGALNLYFSEVSPAFDSRFRGYLWEEVISERRRRNDELEVTCAMTLLAKVEASFRVDYLVRCRTRRRDPITRRLRTVYKLKAHEASLEKDILEAWKETCPQFSKVVGQLRGALHYRHWIAHGRYWEPKLARREYDYLSVYTLAQEVLALPLEQHPKS
jgi:hypothetical protein